MATITRESLWVTYICPECHNVKRVEVEDVPEDNNFRCPRCWAYMIRAKKPS